MRDGLLPDCRPHLLTKGQRDLQAYWEVALCPVCTRKKHNLGKCLEKHDGPPASSVDTVPRLPLPLPLSLFPPSPCSSSRCSTQGPASPNSLSPNLSPGLSSPQHSPLSSIPEGGCRPSSARHTRCRGTAVTQRHTGHRTKTERGGVSADLGEGQSQAVGSSAGQGRTDLLAGGGGDGQAIGKEPRHLVFFDHLHRHHRNDHLRGGGMLVSGRATRAQSLCSCAGPWQGIEEPGSMWESAGDIHPLTHAPLPALPLPGQPRHPSNSGLSPYTGGGRSGESPSPVMEFPELPPGHTYGSLPL